MFQYSCELNIIKHSIFYWGLTKHLVNIIISKPVSNRCKQLSQSIFMKNSNIILIKATKCILDNILISKPVSNRCKQLSQSIFMKNSN